MKYIIVTGGVLSGLGKGVTSSSIGVLLQRAGYRVTAVKMDPYLNCDAGTMNPYEHGEVFVMTDGSEPDKRHARQLAARQPAQPGSAVPE